MEIALLTMETMETVETMEREKWMAVTDTTGGGREQNITSVLKVPKHCLFVLLVSVSI
jgi:hypothetical protein